MLGGNSLSNALGHEKKTYRIRPAFHVASSAEAILQLFVGGARFDWRHIEDLFSVLFPHPDSAPPPPFRTL